jgi:beta-barrel assembly-enhancing protease
MRILTSRRALASLVLTALLVAFLTPPASPFFGELTVQKERQLGEEFFLAIQQVMQVVSDPFVQAYLNRLGQRLVAQLGPGAQPFSYRFFVVNDPSMNAFAVPGGYVFITTGMIRSMEHEGELVGVLAHEISHVHRRHMNKMMEKQKITNIATLAAVLAGILVGNPAVAEGLIVGGMAGGSSMMMKYSRDMEQEADSYGFRWMMKAGYSPRDMMTIFKKMSKQRWFQGNVPVYLSTHPDMETRIIELGHQLAMHLDELPPERDDLEFQYFRTKLEAITGSPYQLLSYMTGEAAREPKNPLYHYGRALALAKLEKDSEAVAAFNTAMILAPQNILIKKDLAIFYFDHNQVQVAEKMLNELSRANPQDESVLYYLGRLYQERKQGDKALPLFEKVHRLNPTFVDVYLNLGTLYGEQGNLGLAHYYLGFHSLRAKAYPTALFHFKKAMTNLPQSDGRYVEVKTQVARLEKLKVKVRD